MRIDVLSGNTLKLTLNNSDMADMGIKYETLSEKSEQTKNLLTRVLDTVKLNASVDGNMRFDFSGERLFVEAFPRPDGGCMLYISCLKESEPEEELSFCRFPQGSRTDGTIVYEEPRKTKPRTRGTRRVVSPEQDVTFTAADLHALTQAVKVLSLKPFFKGEPSELYAEERGGFRLVFKTRYTDEITSVLREFGEIRKGACEAARAREYCKPVCPAHAIELLSSPG